MKSIDGIYRVDMLGPYGWERFSTAFIHEGEFRSASSEHFTSGTYEIEDGGFRMEGNLTQYVDHRPQCGRNDDKRTTDPVQRPNQRRHNRRRSEGTGRQQALTALSSKPHALPALTQQNRDRC